MLHSVTGRIELFAVLAGDGRAGWVTDSIEIQVLAYLLRADAGNRNMAAGSLGKLSGHCYLTTYIFIPAWLLPSPLLYGKEREKQSTGRFREPQLDT